MVMLATDISYIFHTSFPSLCALRRWQTRVPKRLQTSLNPRDPASLLVASTHPKHISGWDHNPQVSEISQTRFLHFSHFCHFILFHPWIYPLKCTVCLKPKQCAVFRQLPTLRFLDEFLTRSSCHCNNQQSLLPLTFKHNSLHKIRAFPQWNTIPNIDHQPGGLKTANVKTCPRYVFAVKSAGLLGERLGELGELSPSSAWCDWNCTSFAGLPRELKSIEGLLQVRSNFLWFKHGGTTNPQFLVIFSYSIRSFQFMGVNDFGQPL